MSNGCLFKGKNTQQHPFCVPLRQKRSSEYSLQSNAVLYLSHFYTGCICRQLFFMGSTTLSAMLYANPAVSAEHMKWQTFFNNKDLSVHLTMWSINSGQTESVCLFKAAVMSQFISGSPLSYVSHCGMYVGKRGRQTDCTFAHTDLMESGGYSKIVGCWWTV